MLRKIVVYVVVLSLPSIALSQDIRKTGMWRVLVRVCRDNLFDVTLRWDSVYRSKKRSQVNTLVGRVVVRTLSELFR